MREKHSRTIAKAITWRIVATLVTAILAYIFTGSFKIALEIGAADLVLKLLFYYFHERIWGKVIWGKST